MAGSVVFHLCEQGSIVAWKLCISWDIPCLVWSAGTSHDLCGHQGNNVLCNIKQVLKISYSEKFIIN